MIETQITDAASNLPSPARFYKRSPACHLIGLNPTRHGCCVVRLSTAIIPLPKSPISLKVVPVYLEHDTPSQSPTFSCYRRGRAGGNPHRCKKNQRYIDPRVPPILGGGQLAFRSSIRLYIALGTKAFPRVTGNIEGWRK